MQRSRESYEPSGSADRAAVIVDVATHAYFHFLPPLGNQVQPVGELDATLIGDLAVEICEWKGTGCGTRVGCLTARSHGAERLRIEHDDIDHYHANWRVAATLSEQVS